MSAPTLCRYFVAQGKCFYGAECKFAHSLPDGSVPTASSASTSDVPATAASQSRGNSDGLTVPAGAATTAAAPANSTLAAPTPKLSSLAGHAGAKEWTPSASPALPVAAVP